MPSPRSIFISYRRLDSEYVADRIYESLTDYFGADSVFFDIDVIPFGVDFKEYIYQSVSQCTIFLAIIGRSWLTITDEKGVRRLDSEKDFVRLEIESAFKAGIPVIPLLVGGAEVPKIDQLPENLHELVLRNGLHIRSGQDYRTDINNLIRNIESNYPSLIQSSQKLVNLATISSNQIDTSQGFGYKVYASDLPELTDIPADSARAHNASPLVLLENGTPLNHGHSSHRDIVMIGEGKYSHWDGGDDSIPHRIYLWFSTSDNSDPRSNNKTYKIAAPRNSLPGRQQGSEIKVFDNTNREAVENGGISPFFNVPAGKAYRLVSIQTYHWNYAQGKVPGKLGIEDGDGNRKEWQATATSGDSNAQNVNWSVDVNEPVVLQDINGSYKVLDSDPETWSHNSRTRGQGFAIVWLRLLSQNELELYKRS